MAYNKEKGITSFADGSPDLVCEWDWDKNIGITPDTVAYHSSKKVWWKCANGHEWEQSLLNKSLSEKLCLLCRHEKVSEEYNFFVIHPDLMEHWDYEKNTVDPRSLMPRSGKRVWWICRKCDHSWDGSLSNKFIRPNCPKCTDRSSSFPEQSLYYYFKRFFKDTKNRYQYESNGITKEIDVYIPSLKIGIEYDGYFHKNRQENDQEKNILFNKEGIKLFRIRYETKTFKLPRLELFGSEEFQHDPINKYKDLEDAIVSIFKYIDINHPSSKIYSKDKFIKNINMDKERIKIASVALINQRNKSLIFTSKELIKEWNYEKNVGISPEQFTHGSLFKVWWKCSKCNYEWEFPIVYRKNSSCPECGKNRGTLENCLSTENPKLSLEWHPSKNGILTPFNVTPRSATKVWWLCSCGHEWETRVKFRNQKGKDTPECPACFLRRTSLGSTCPYIAEEWHPTLNGEITPFDVRKHEMKLYWWLCENGHEWQAQVASRHDGLGKKTSCVECNKIKRKIGVDLN